MRRVTSFMDPWQDQLGAGYQLSNALMAIGRGEWFGVGLGASVQKLSYLPEAHTDFIFSVIAEELGFAGVCLVIGLYALLAGRAFWLGLKCVEMKRHFAGYCAFGIALVDGAAKPGLDGREPGLAADQGPDPAADFLRRFQRADDLRGAGSAAAGVVRIRACRPPGRQAARRGATAAPTRQSAGHLRSRRCPADAGARGTSRLRQRVEPSLGSRDVIDALATLRRQR